MKTDTTNNLIMITLDKEDAYLGHKQLPNGDGQHEFILCGGAKVSITKKYHAIIRVVTHDGWSIDQRANGELIMCNRHVSRKWVPYAPPVSA